MITVYGAESVEQAATEILSRGVVGAESLEMLLKAQGAQEKAPEPLTFQSPKLNRMTANPDLSRYDEFLFGESQTAADQPGAGQASTPDADNGDNDRGDS